MRDFVVILCDIRSMHNVGSIFRTADAAGASKIYLCGITPEPVDVFGRERAPISKVSLGAEKYLAWEKKKSAVKLIKSLKNSPAGGKYKIFAVEQDKKSISYRTISKFITHNSKFCLVMGNEVEGLPKNILKLADKIIEIPMKGKKESLNVSVAFGIVAFSL